MDGQESSLSFGLNMWGLILLWKLSGVSGEEVFSLLMRTGPSCVFSR